MKENLALTVKRLRQLADRLEKHEGPGLVCEWSHSTPSEQLDFYQDIKVYGVSDIETIELKVVLNHSPFTKPLIGGINAPS